jgi:alginate O-acetyltransferase complex protein AlgI
MTLSRFLRDYLYIPLGGSRRGPGRRSANLMATMLLGGLWHGAGWTFVAWGLLHGLYLLANHAWIGFAARAETRTGSRPALGAPLGRALTLLAVAVAWVFFAAPDFGSAAAVLAGMAGANGLARPELSALAGLAFDGGFAALREKVGGAAILHHVVALGALAFGMAVAFAAPNSQEIMDGRSVRVDEPRRWKRLRFRPTPAAGFAAAAAFLFAFALMAKAKEFVYFQF